MKDHVVSAEEYNALREIENAARDYFDAGDDIWDEVTARRRLREAVLDINRIRGSQ